MLPETVWQRKALQLHMLRYKAIKGQRLDLVVDGEVVDGVKRFSL